MCAWQKHHLMGSRYSVTRLSLPAPQLTARWRRRLSTVSARPRGLGRGLDALLPKVEQGAQRLPVSELRPSALQPRKTFDPEALAELAASIKEKGVLQPILVRPVTDGYEIVAGERRYQAA